MARDQQRPPRASIRNLRHACHQQLARIDDDALAARAALEAATSGKFHPEYEMLVLLNRARVLAESTFRPWPVVARELAERYKIAETGAQG